MAKITTAMEVIPKTLKRTDATDLITQAEIVDYVGESFTNINDKEFADYAWQGTRIANILLNNAISKIGGFNGIYNLDEETQLNTGHLTKESLDTLKSAIANMIASFKNHLIAPSDRTPFEIEHNIGPENKKISMYAPQDLLQYVDTDVKAQLVATGIEKFIKYNVLPSNKYRDFLQYSDLTTDVIVNKSIAQGGFLTGALDWIVNRLGIGRTNLTEVDEPLIESISGNAITQKGINVEDKAKNSQQDLRLENLENSTGAPLAPLQLKAYTGADQTGIQQVGAIVNFDIIALDPQNAMVSNEYEMKLALQGSEVKSDGKINVVSDTNNTEVYVRVESVWPDTSVHTIGEKSQILPNAGVGSDISIESTTQIIGATGADRAIFPIQVGDKVRFYVRLDESGGEELTITGLGNSVFEILVIQTPAISISTEQTVISDIPTESINGTSASQQEVNRENKIAINSKDTIVNVDAKIAPKANTTDVNDMLDGTTPFTSINLNGFSISNWPEIKDFLNPFQRGNIKYNRNSLSGTSAIGDKYNDNFGNEWTLSAKLGNGYPILTPATGFEDNDTPYNGQLMAHNHQWLIRAHRNDRGGGSRETTTGLVGYNAAGTGEATNQFDSNSGTNSTALYTNNTGTGGNKNIPSGKYLSGCQDDVIWVYVCSVEYVSPSRAKETKDAKEKAKPIKDIGGSDGGSKDKKLIELLKKGII